jgi:hypothetical protein
MSLPTHPKQVPASARPFFQEYDFDLLDENMHAPLIIERILAYGNRAEVRWLLELYGREQVKNWVVESGMRKLPWRRYHLWCFVFSLPIQKRPDRIWPH